MEKTTVKSKQRRVDGPSKETVPAETVRDTTEQGDSRLTATDVEAIVQGEVKNLVPGLVTKSLQANTSKASKKEPTGADHVEFESSDSDTNGDGSETDDADILSDEENDDVQLVREQALRKRALKSRRLAVTGTPVRASPQQLLPADLLPAIESKVLRKIKKGEFVDLTLCLPTLSQNRKIPVMTPTINSEGDPA